MVCLDTLALLVRKETVVRMVDLVMLERKVLKERKVLRDFADQWAHVERMERKGKLENQEYQVLKEAGVILDLRATKVQMDLQVFQGCLGLLDLLVKTGHPVPLATRVSQDHEGRWEYLENMVLLDLMGCQDLEVPVVNVDPLGNEVYLERQV